MWQGGCSAQQGFYVGDNTQCGPNVCPSVVVLTNDRATQRGNDADAHGIAIFPQRIADGDGRLGETDRPRTR